MYSCYVIDMISVTAIRFLLKRTCKLDVFCAESLTMNTDTTQVHHLSFLIELEVSSKLVSTVSERA